MGALTWIAIIASICMAGQYVDAIKACYEYPIWSQLPKSAPDWSDEIGKAHKGKRYCNEECKAKCQEKSECVAYANQFVTKFIVPDHCYCNLYFEGKDYKLKEDIGWTFYRCEGYKGQGPSKRDDAEEPEEEEEEDGDN